MSNKWVWIIQESFEMGFEGIFTTKKKAVEYAKSKGYNKIEKNHWCYGHPKDEDDFLMINKRRLL